MEKLSVGWGPISACNMNCQFCYSRHKRIDSTDLQLENWIDFIDGNHAVIDAINYGTGENSLSLDWFKLVDYIRTKYPTIRQAVTTNGYLGKVVRKNDWCLEVFKRGIDEVDVSLDFADATTHNTFRGCQYAYEDALDTLGLTQEYHKPTTIVFLGSKKNVYKENIDGLFSIAKRYDAILRMNIFRPTYGINNHSEQFIISRNVVIDTIKYIAEKYQILAINDSYFSSILIGHTTEDPNASCSIRILSDGSITPSTYLIDKKYTIANIRDANILLDEQIRGNLAKITEKIVPIECVGCIYEQTCAGGVCDRRYLWYGTLHSKDPYCSEAVIETSANKIVLGKQKFASVHDGYLPTIFFMP